MRRGTTSVCKTDGSKESVEGKELQETVYCSNPVATSLFCGLSNPLGALELQPLQRICRAPISTAQPMGIDAHGHARLGVSQSRRHLHNGHVGIQQERCVGVAQVVEPQALDACLFQPRHDENTPPLAPIAPKEQFIRLQLGERQESVLHPTGERYHAVALLCLGGTPDCLAIDALELACDRQGGTLSVPVTAPQCHRLANPHATAEKDADQRVGVGSLTRAQDAPGQLYGQLRGLSEYDARWIGGVYGIAYHPTPAQSKVTRRPEMLTSLGTGTTLSQLPEPCLDSVGCDVCQFDIAQRRDDVQPCAGLRALVAPWTPLRFFVREVLVHKRLHRDVAPRLGQSSRRRLLQLLKLLRGELARFGVPELPALGRGDSRNPQTITALVYASLALAAFFSHRTGILRKAAA